MKSLITTFAFITLALFAGCTGKPTTPEEHAKLQGVMDYEDEQQQDEMNNQLGPDTIVDDEASGEIPLNSGY